jgi:hypothetical protein
MTVEQKAALLDTTTFQGAKHTWAMEITSRHLLNATRAVERKMIAGEILGGMMTADLIEAAADACLVPVPPGDGTPTVSPIDDIPAEEWSKVTSCFFVRYPSGKHPMDVLMEMILGQPTPEPPSTRQQRQPRTSRRSET